MRVAIIDTPGPGLITRVPTPRGAETG